MLMTFSHNVCMRMTYFSYIGKNAGCCVFRVYVSVCVCVSEQECVCVSICVYVYVCGRACACEHMAFPERKGSRLQCFSAVSVLGADFV